MADITKTAIREPDVQTPAQFGRRVRRLAIFYTGLFVVSVIGILLLVWRGQMFVTLTQRSNIETLTLGFFIIFFAYIGVLSVGGLVGAARIAYYAALGRLGHDRLEVEQRKHRALGRPSGKNPSVALNVVLELEGKQAGPFTVPIQDEAGSLGALEIDGAEIKHLEAHKGGSNSLLAFAAQQIQSILRERGVDALLDVVDWRTIDDEATAQYLGLVRFAVNLERQLGARELWPKVILTADDLQKLEQRLAAICPALRDEAFLPDWEYAGEHKLPIIPEPLGLVSLSRTEKRVDPEASMGCALLVVLAAVFIFALFVVFPPWVPGS